MTLSQWVLSFSSHRVFPASPRINVPWEHVQLLFFPRSIRWSVIPFFFFDFRPKVRHTFPG